MLFSERNHLLPEKIKFQRNEVDEALRMRLWNLICLYYWDVKNDDVMVSIFNHDNPLYDLAFQIQENFLNKPLDSLGIDLISIRNSIKQYFFNCMWFRVYDFLEFLIQTDFIHIREDFYRDGSHLCFADDVNSALEKESSAYRLVGNIFMPITDEIEINAINDGMSAENPYEAVRIHLQTAAKYLSDRQKPDYRNSIKESISAVEAICKIITGNEKGTLGAMLKKLEENGIQLHEAFRESINKLYGYTSDKDGIRHCLTDAPTVDYADAKYMLVVCSAFCNFLIDKNRKLH